MRFCCLTMYSTSYLLNKHLYFWYYLSALRDKSLFLRNQIESLQGKYGFWGVILYLLSVPGMRESILEELTTSIKDCDQALEW